MQKSIDLTDYSCLPNSLVFMFTSFHLISSHEGYFATFSKLICLLSSNSIKSLLHFNHTEREIRVNIQRENEAIE